MKLLGKENASSFNFFFTQLSISTLYLFYKRQADMKIVACSGFEVPTFF